MILTQEYLYMEFSYLSFDLQILYVVTNINSY